MRKSASLSTAGFPADAHTLDPAAARDLTNICDHIHQQATQATARRVALLIYRSAGSLHKFPYRGRAGRKPDTRELVLTNLPYVVIYRVRENVVEIIRILHGAQNWP